MATYYVSSGGDNSDGLSWATAWTSLQSAIDAVGPGDYVYCQGTQTLGATIDFDGTDGTVTSPIYFIGCNSGTTNEPPQTSDLGTDRFTLNANGGSYNAATPNGMNYLVIVNFAFTGAAGSNDGVGGVTANSQYWIYVNCKFYNNGGSGHSSVFHRDTIFKQCVFSGNAIGIDSTNPLMIACSFLNNTTVGVGYVAGIVYNCLFDGNAVAAYVQSSGPNFFNCVMHDGTSGLDNNYQAGHNCAIGIRITNQTNPLDSAANYRLPIDYIYSDGNFSGAGLNLQIPDKTMTTHCTQSGGDTDDGYTDSATSDFNLDPAEATYFDEPIVIPLT